MKPLAVIVLISGNGSNLQAMIDNSQQAPFTITAVISDQADAYGLERAKAAGIPTTVLARPDYADRNRYNSALLDAVLQYQPDIIALAGFMRILEGDILTRYHGKILNIHPQSATQISRITHT